MIIRMIRWVFAVVLLLAGVSQALSQEGRVWQVKDWEISEQSHMCFGKAASMVSGSTRLFFAIGKEGISVFVFNSKWRMTPGRVAKVAIFIDGQPSGEYPTRNFDESMTETPIPPSLVPKLQAGDEVKLEFELTSFAFPLKFSRAGLAALINCYSQKVSVQETASLPDQSGDKRNAGPQLTSGSGFFIARDGHIITNNHVVGNCATPIVSGYGPARVIRRDPQNDIALIKINGEAKGIASLSVDEPNHAQKILAFGYPFSLNLRGGLTVTSGIVSSLTGIDGDIRYVQISAAVQPGNSGGPLLNSNGQVVGLVTGKADAMQIASRTGAIPENIAWALRSDIIRQFLRVSGITVDKGTTAATKSDEEIAKEAGDYTVLIYCAG